jgi:signal transduction histidine kinase
LNTLVANFAPLIKGKLEKHNISLKLQSPSTLPPIIAPEDGLKQVLFNLTSNAIEAMPNGGRLSISVAANSHDVTLQISDTGIGLSPEAEKRLFEPFFSTKGVAGNGLGLAMVHGIITECNGAIKAANNAGDGCTFAITLPVAK